MRASVGVGVGVGVGGGAGAAQAASLDLSRCFLPEALAGLASARALRTLNDDDRRRLNQIRACSYLHLFDTFERSLCAVSRERSRIDVDARAVLAPLQSADSFDHHDLFRSFEKAFAQRFSVEPRLVPPPEDLTKVLISASSPSLLVLALHLKLLTQHHYLACMRGDERLEPHFVRLLKDHWFLECGGASMRDSPRAIEQALGRALPGSVPSALREYRMLVFSCDDVLRRQAELDVLTLEDARGDALQPAERTQLARMLVAAHRKTFLTDGIANAPFVYAMRDFGPSVPALLAGIVSALSSR